MKLTPIRAIQKAFYCFLAYLADKEENQRNNIVSGLSHNDVRYVMCSKWRDTLQIPFIFYSKSATESASVIIRFLLHEISATSRTNKNLIVSTQRH